MAASVRIEDEAFGDDRYDALAAFAGLVDADHARGKMARLWRQCTIEQTHNLQPETITRWLGENGIDALVRSRLGERNEDGTVRIRGTNGRIEWLGQLRKNGRFGKMGGRPKKTHQGFVEKPTRVRKNAKHETPPAPAPAPSGISDLSHAREAVAQPSTGPTGGPPHASPDWTAAKHGVMRAITPLHVDRFNAVRVDIGSTVPPLQHIEVERGLRQLLDGMPGFDGVEACCRHVVETGEVQARATRSLKHFGPSLWHPNSYAKAKTMTLDEARAGPTKRNGENREPADPPVEVIRPKGPSRYRNDP